VFFHIGDGAGVALHQLDGKSTYTLSRPANGRFSCETYFYTMKNWKESLRFTKINKSEALFLMTDGVTNFALSDDMCELKKGFIEPINRFLKNETNKNKALMALNNTLNTKQARKLNSDDKTFLWAGL
jgi:serine/threonine protein phosphatase PrpC